MKILFIILLLAVPVLLSANTANHIIFNNHTDDYNTEVIISKGKIIKKIERLRSITSKKEDVITLMKEIQAEMKKPSDDYRVNYFSCILNLRYLPLVLLGLSPEDYPEAILLPSSADMGYARYEALDPFTWLEKRVEGKVFLSSIESPLAVVKFNLEKIIIQVEAEILDLYYDERIIQVDEPDKFVNDPFQIPDLDKIDI